MLFLLKKDASGLGKGKKTAYWIYQLVAVFAAAAALGLLLLIFAYSNYTKYIFDGYFKNCLIIVLNVLPVVLLMFLLYFLTGRAWIAFLATSVITVGFSLGNMYKILFRDDPFIFEDLKNIVLGLKIAGVQKYDLTPSGRVWVGIAAVAVATLALFFLVRGKLKPKVRLPLALVPVIVFVCVFPAYKSDNVYYNKTDNSDYINQWSTTQVFISKGFVYPFLHSAAAAEDKMPEGYSAEEAERLLQTFKDADIPEDKKVDVFFIMRESYNDFSKFSDVDGIDFSLYETYHALKEESYTGTLFTNIFAGGTVDTERGVMSGCATLKNHRSDADSYVRYFKSQGYATVGSHPCYAWFYNRLNINTYYGFDNYFLFENYYTDFRTNERLFVNDDVFFREITKLYERREKDKPYFSFNVTYQGHGPYNTQAVEWEGADFVHGDYSDYAKNVLNNYFGGIKESDIQLAALVDYFREESRPVVLCVFGDHNPWLGDGNSVYKEMGVDIDFASEQGVRNYYENEYLIWANDAAKKVLGNGFTGRGPTVSPCYLMNQLFELCGWQGPAYMQLMDTYKSEIPVVNTAGFYEINGELVTELPSSMAESFRQFTYLQYYRRNEFKG